MYNKRNDPKNVPKYRLKHNTHRKNIDKEHRRTKQDHTDVKQGPNKHNKYRERIFPRDEQQHAKHRRSTKKEQRKATRGRQKQKRTTKREQAQNTHQKKDTLKDRAKRYRHDKNKTDKKG